MSEPIASLSDLFSGPAFFHVTLFPADGVRRREVTETFDKALDWYSYADNCWVIYTTGNEEVWTKRLEKLTRPDGSVLVLKFRPEDAQGWMDKDFWKWLKKAR